MRALSFFLLKNSLASKMKRGIRSFCNGVGSTSTLNQRKAAAAAAVDVSCIAAAPSLSGGSSSYLEEEEERPNTGGRRRSPLTLEEMILQLDLEEEAARRAELDEIYGDLQQQQQRRMSCVNNSDILRSARNALNQYPRFSLDGRDAMYQSTFRDIGGRKSVCCTRGLGGSRGRDWEGDLGMLPPTLAGESVVWCKPGVVAKLMGLDAVPVPLGCGGDHRGKRRSSSSSGAVATATRKQNLRRMGRRELERERLVLMGGGGMRRRRESVGSCSSAAAEYDYCVMRPISVEPVVKGRPDCRFARAR